MTTVYVDPQRGNDTTGNGSITSPFATRTKGRQATGAGAHSVLVKRGSVETLSTTFQATSCNGTGPSTPFRFGVYGDAADGPAIIRAPSNITDLMFVLGGAQYIEVSDWDFDGQGFNQTPINIQSNTADVIGITFRRCRAYNTTVRNGMTADGKVAGYKITDLLFEDCEAFNNAAHGFFAVGDVDVTYRRCRAMFNGATATNGGHGFSSIAYRNQVTAASWVLQSGTTYRVSTGGVTPLKVIINGHGTYPVLANAGATATPSAGQWGYTGGFLYINTNDAATSYTGTYSYTVSPTILYEQCEAFNNIAFAGAPYHEGHGFAADDFTSYARFIGCISRDNEGNGISLNSGDYNTITGLVAYRNDLPAIQSWRGTGHRIINNTLIDNNTSAYADSEVRLSGMSTSAIVSNNIIRADGGSQSTVGLEFDSTSTSGTAANNNITGASTRSSGVTESGALSSDPAPYLTDSYRLVYSVSSPFVSGGTYLPAVTLRNGRCRPRATPVGAYAALLPRSARV